MSNSLEFTTEKKVWGRKQGVILGVDEVGRGSISGPLVFGVCGFDSATVIPAHIVIRDSKKLTQKQKEMAYIWIMEHSCVYSIFECDNRFIDENGMSRALAFCARGALNEIYKKLKNSKNDHPISKIFLDGKNSLGLDSKYSEHLECVVSGDAKIMTVACASIIAKVYRDSLMKSLSYKFSSDLYGWRENKGYGTRKHLNAIKKHGVSRYHRLSFLGKQANY